MSKLFLFLIFSEKCECVVGGMGLHVCFCIFKKNAQSANFI